MSKSTTIKRDGIFDGLFFPPGMNGMTIAEIEQHIFGVERVRIVLRVTLPSYRHKFSYPQRRLPQTATLKDLLDRINLAFNAAAGNAKIDSSGTGWLLVLPNGDVIRSGAGIESKKSARLRRLRFPT